MKLFPLLFFPFAFLLGPFLNAQAVHFFGAANKNDECFDMIATADGHRLVAGAVDNDAAIYKFDCQGRLVDSIRKDLTLASSFEAVRGLLELPNGEILAVGTAKALPSVNCVLVMRLSAGLDELAFDTLRINGKTAEGRSIIRSAATGEVFIAGVVAGAGLDFGDIFWQKIDPNTLDPIGSAAIFSSGIDEVSSVSETADGHFLIAGHSVAGNIFSADADLANRPFCRKIKADGTQVWLFELVQTSKNKFGRAVFSTAIEDAATGNVLLAGQLFTGDTTTNTLDASFKLLSAAGQEIGSASFARAGAQRIFQTRWAKGTTNLAVSVGDSLGIAGGAGRLVSTAVFVQGNMIFGANFSADPTTAGLLGRAFLHSGGEEFEFAGIWQNPSGGSANADLFYATTSAFSVEIVQNGPNLEAMTSQTGVFSYQWLFQNQPISGATGAIFTPSQSGNYTVTATNALGCTASASFSFVGSAGGSAPLFWFVTDTVCAPGGAVPLALVNDAASYDWTFSDGATSVEKAPFHFFQNAGTQSAKLCIATKTSQRIATPINVLSCGQPNLAELTDLVADPYFILKDATGQTIYTSLPLNDMNPPYSLPCAILLEPGKTYEFSLFDADFIGQDDFLGNVQIANAATGGTFSFGVVALEFTTVVAEPTYCWGETLVVIPQPPKPTIVYNAALDRLEVEPKGWHYTYSWFLNGAGVVAGVDPYSPFLADPANGNWQVSVSGPHCSAGWSDIVPITVAAREPIWLDGLRLVPNPTDGPFSLFFDQKAGEKAELELFDLAGRRIEKWSIGGATAFSIDFAGRPAGVYSLIFRDEKRSAARRVLVF